MFAVAFPVLMFILLILLFTQELLISIAFQRTSVAFWVLIAISAPISSTFTPLAVLAVIHLPLSSMIVCAYCKHHRHSEHDHDEEQVTLHRSSNWSLLHQPSYTTWCSPHSGIDSVNCSNTKPQDYGSINAH